MILCLNVTSSLIGTEQSIISNGQHAVKICSGKNTEITGKTTNLTETSIQVTTDKEPNLSSDKKVKLCFNELDDNTLINCTIKDVQNNNCKLEIVQDKDSKANLDYLSLLYDDDSVLPSKNRTFTFVFVL